LEGEGQIRALLSWNGNPAAVFPDQMKTISALKSLDLLVQVDPWMSATAQLADYVIAPTMPLEVPSSTVALDDASSMPFGYGLGESYANYTLAVADRPPGSELIEEWKFFKGLYSRIACELEQRGEGVLDAPAVMEATTTDELLEILSAGSRVSLGVVRDSDRGSFYVDECIRVRDKDADWSGKFDVGNDRMLAALAEIAESGMPSADSDVYYNFRLICRRENHVYNTSYNFPATNRGKPYNPAFIHPDDLASLGLRPGDLADVTSSRGNIVVIVDADDRLRRGLVSMAFGFGGPPETDHLVRTIGSNPGRLIADDELFDPYIGQPRMSNVPVRVVPHIHTAESDGA
jgi:anaerobic selenocysteine-containing dehydrogenase